MQHTNKSAPAGATQPSVAEQELPDFEDPKVQAVYEILCDTECAGKPRDEHWEGWQARRIVKALEQERCYLCDCTGDVHGFDGEWRGECPYCKPPRGQEPLYQKEKRRAEMWIAKYEQDIGKLERAVPAAPQPQPKQALLTDEKILSRGPGEESAVWSYEDQLYFARAIIAEYELAVALLPPVVEQQKPAAWASPRLLEWSKRESEKVVKLTRKEQPAYGFTVPLYTGPYLHRKPLKEEAIRKLLVPGDYLTVAGLTKLVRAVEQAHEIIE